MGTKTTNKNLSEDEIIANGLLSIRNGLLSNDWKLVADGYNSISGEDIEPPQQEKQKTRLERIREIVSSNNEANAESEPVKEALTIKEIKDKLTKKGFKGKDLNCKKKSELLLLLNSGSEPIIKKIVTTEIDGGENFGKGKIQIISDSYDPFEAEMNEEISKNKTSIRAKPQRITGEKDTSKTESDVRFYKDPPKPPWR